MHYLTLAEIKIESLLVFNKLSTGMLWAIMKTKKIRSFVSAYPTTLLNT